MRSMAISNSPLAGPSRSVRSCSVSSPIASASIGSIPRCSARGRSWAWPPAGARASCELMVCRTLLGFFEAGHWPCALKTTFALLNEKDRTMGNSVLQSGASIGAIITPQIMKLLMTEQPGSWRTTFIVVGAAGFRLGCGLALLPATSRSGSCAGDDSEEGRARSRRHPAQRTLLGGGAAHRRRADGVAYLSRVADEVPANRSRLRGEGGAGFQLALLHRHRCRLHHAPASISLWLIRRCGACRRTMHGARCMRARACSPRSACLFRGWGKAGRCSRMLLLIGAGRAGACFPATTALCRSFPPHHVGRLTGLLSLWVWAVTSPMHSFFGMLVDRTKSYDLGLVIAGLAPWLGVIAMKLLWKKTRITRRRCNHLPMLRRILLLHVRAVAARHSPPIRRKRRSFPRNSRRRSRCCSRA